MRSGVFSFGINVSELSYVLYLVSRRGLAALVSLHGLLTEPLLVTYWGNLVLVLLKRQFLNHMLPHMDFKRITAVPTPNYCLVVVVLWSYP